MGKHSNRRTKTQRFAGIPHVVMETEKYRSLSAWAVKMLIELAKQYNGPGSNNGDLSLAWSQARNLGWNSPATVSRAEKELRRAGMIIRTRQGGLVVGCSLYALSWVPIDECINRKTGRSKMDPPWKSTQTPPGTWRDGVESWPN